MAHDAAVRWENPLAGEDFPVIVENGEPRAVVLDIVLFRQLQAFLDNLSSVEEPEDAILANSPVVRALAEKAFAAGGTKMQDDWRRLLHECEG